MRQSTRIARTATKHEAGLDELLEQANGKALIEMLSMIANKILRRTSATPQVWNHRQVERIDALQIQNDA